MGAIASGGIRVLNDGVILAYGVTDDQIAHTTDEEQRELEWRERTFRGDRERAQVEGRCVILVDDGVATGSTMRAALQALSQQLPREIVVAVPVAAAGAVHQLKREANAVICLETPRPFMSIGQWYVDFGQTSSDEVRELLQQGWERR